MTKAFAGLAGVVLAAGGSARLGQPKQLLEHAGQTLVQRAVVQAQSVCDCGIVVVTGAQGDAVAAELQGTGARIMHNPDWQSGMAGSLRAALRALDDSGCDAALLMVCDQPRIGTAHLAALAALWQNAPSRAAAAAYDGQPGVPAIVPRSWFAQLAGLQGDQGARGLLRANSDTQLLDMPDAATDIDTPDDLTQLDQ